MDMSESVTADLDLACELLDLARHIVVGFTPASKLRPAVENVIFGSEPNRLIREWEQRKRATVTILKGTAKA